MAEFDRLKMDLKTAQEAFAKGFGELSEKFTDTLSKENEGTKTLLRSHLTDGLLKQPVDFSLYYCLMETIEQCDRAIKEKPSREMSLVKTNLQQALHWLNDAQ